MITMTAIPKTNPAKATSDGKINGVLFVGLGDAMGESEGERLDELGVGVSGAVCSGVAVGETGFVGDGVSRFSKYSWSAWAEP